MNFAEINLKLQVLFQVIVIMNLLFYAENFRTQWQNEPNKEIDAKPKYAGPYEVYIRNSFGYEKKYYTEVKFSVINTLNLAACDIVFEPGYMEIEVP